jgi:hypothetical protein
MTLVYGIRPIAVTRLMIKKHAEFLYYPQKKPLVFGNLSKVKRSKKKKINADAEKKSKHQALPNA